MAGFASYQSTIDGTEGFVPKRSTRGLIAVLVFHLVLGWALMNGLAQRMVEVVRAPFETKLIEDVRPPPPPPIPLLPPPTATPPPLVIQVPVPQVQQQQPPPTPAPAPPPEAPPPPSPVPPPAVQAATITAPAPAPPPPPAHSGAAARNPDEAYIGSLRGYLNGIKRYPTSREARQLRPQGTVRLWLEIDRAGQLLNAGVEGTSGSLLLDNEALRTVRNGRFPPMPAEAFAGQASRRFVVPIEYLLEGS